MKLNLRFVNTGLDDRIVKSMQDGTHPAKTMKQVFVHDKKKGDYYRMQPVNVQQPESIKHPAHKPEETTGNSSTADNPAAKVLKTLTNLLSKLHTETNTQVKVKKLKTSEDNDAFIYRDIQRGMWRDIENLIKEDSYKGFTVLKGESSANYTLGGENYENYVGKQPGATHFEKFDKSLTNWDATSVAGYTYSKWTYRMNNYYRGLSGEGVKLPENQFERDMVATMATHLDSTIEKYELEKPMVVYRTVRIDALSNILSNGDGTFRDNGFASTTVVKDGFNLGNEPVLTMVIKVPSGKGHGAWLKPISQIPRENEFLLARGSMFNIDSLDVKFDKNGNPVGAVMEASIIGHAPNPIEPPKNSIDYLDYVDACEDIDDDDEN